MGRHVFQNVEMGWYLLKAAMMETFSTGMDARRFAKNKTFTPVQILVQKNQANANTTEQAI